MDALCSRHWVHSHPSTGRRDRETRAEIEADVATADDDDDVCDSFRDVVAVVVVAGGAVGVADIVDVVAAASCDRRRGDLAEIRGR